MNFSHGNESLLIEWLGSYFARSVSLALEECAAMNETLKSSEIARDIASPTNNRVTVLSRSRQKGAKSTSRHLPCLRGNPCANLNPVLMQQKVSRTA